MATFLLILTIIFGIATITTMFIIAFWSNDDDAEETFSILCLFLSVFTAISAIGFRIATPEKPHEFPAAKYELKYKVTEFDRVSDTTYVLVPKKNE